MSGGMFDVRCSEREHKSLAVGPEWRNMKDVIRGVVVMSCLATAAAPPPVGAASAWPAESNTAAYKVPLLDPYFASNMSERRLLTCESYDFGKRTVEVRFAAFSRSLRMGGSMV